MATPNRADTVVSDADTPAEISSRGWRDVVWRSVQAVVAQDLSLGAAGVAFFAVWALFPAVVVLVVIAAHVLGRSQVQWLLSQVRLDLPEAFNTVVTSQLDVIAQHSPRISIATIAVAMILSLWSGMRGVHGLIAALNGVYGEEERRSYWRRQMSALLLCLLGGVFTFAALARIVGLAGSGAISAADVRPLAPSRWPALVLGMMLVLAVLYRYGPCRETPKWRWVTCGAVVAGAIWLAASYGLSYYAAHYASLNPMLGSLGSVVLFLLWCYLSVLAVLLGAKINAELERHTVADTSADQ